MHNVQTPEHISLSRAKLNIHCYIKQSLKIKYNIL